MMWPRNVKEMPRVKTVMTAFPYSIDQRGSLKEAQKMMAKHRIHHLPVMEKGVPLGAISHRDLTRALEGASEDSDESLTVADLPRDEAYVVDLSEPLDGVLRRMAERRLEAALVVKDDRLAGIFTLTDACRCFAESLREQFPREGGDEAA